MLIKAGNSMFEAYQSDVVHENMTSELLKFIASYERIELIEKKKSPLINDEPKKLTIVTTATFFDLRTPHKPLSSFFSAIGIQCRPWPLQVLWNITAQAIGLFIGNLMGPFMSMKTFAYVAIFFNILFLGLFPLVPDSPYRLIMIGDLNKAEAALKWFRRKNDVKQELQELQDYVSTASASLIERLKELGQSKYRKGFFMLFLINIFSYFGAYNVTNNYMEIIVTISQANVTPSIVVTTVGAFSVISGLTATFLVDRFGRRLLLITSSLGMAISMACLGLHFQLLDLGFNPITLSWLPCSCLLVYTVSYSAGAGCIPSTLVGEIFSPKLKTIASLTFSGTSAVFSSMSTGTFVPFQHIIGINFLFWFYATGTFVSVLYYYYFVPETMGKSLQTIQIEELEKHSRKNSKA